MSKFLSGSSLKTLGKIAGGALAIALVVKFFSKDQKCPNCDRVIRAVNLFGAVCPHCVRLPFKA